MWTFDSTCATKVGAHAPVLRKTILFFFSMEKSCPSVWPTYKHSELAMYLVLKELLCLSAHFQFESAISYPITHDFFMFSPSHLQS